MAKKIVIFDDERSIGQRWKGQLEVLEPVKDGFSVEAVQIGDFREFVIELEDRRRKSRKGNFELPKHSEFRLDNTAILFIDYDLFALDKNSYITGETIAYLARCYSRCGLIIGINAFGTNPFDLTLRGHPESYADLNIGGKQISSLGFWLEPWSGFRPWHWPLIPAAVAALDRRSKELINHLDEPVTSFLGIPEHVIRFLPRSTCEFIVAGKSRIEETTFRGFVQDSRSNNGLRRKDKAPDELIARIAAARIGKWLERLVLPGQDIIVDGPHLISRYPSLIRGDLDDIGQWNRTTSLGEASQLRIQHTLIKQFQFPKRDWLSRPGWFWRDMSNHEKIREVTSPWEKTKRPELVFCEDISRFLPTISSREFVADLPSQYVRRFCSLASAPELRESAEELKQVDYVPQGRFAL